MCKTRLDTRDHINKVDNMVDLCHIGLINNKLGVL